MRRYTVIRRAALGALIALALTAGIGLSRAQAPTTVTLTPLALAPGASGAVLGRIECGGAGCGGFAVTIRFDPAVIRVDAAAAGPYLGERVFVGEHVIDNDAGRVRLVAAALGAPPAGDATLFRLDITALADGIAVLSIAALEVADLDGQPLPVRGIGSVVTVTTPRPPTPAPSGPAAAPVATQIAFVSERDGNPDLYLIHTDGTGLARLTSDPAADTYPAWSPDGRRIAFVSERGGSADIYVMNADGSELARLTDDPAPDLYPAWSPDGQWLAFASARDGNTDLYVVSATSGGTPRRLTFHPAADLMPTWSPNGARLAFISERDGPGDIYLLVIGESDVVRLTNSQGTTHNWFPAWSPDGTRISFVVERGGRGEIYTIQPNGAYIRRLSQQPDTVSRTAWSPDSARLAFVSEREGSPDIYVMDSTGANPRRLTANPAPDYDPSWRPAEGPCLVWAERADVAIRVGPGVERGLFGYLPTGQSFFATGQAADISGARWWRIDKTQLTDSDKLDSLWVAQAEVLRYGGCGTVAFVEAPPVLYGEPSGPAPTPTGSGLWGVCGSCDSCGPYPVGECVLSPEGACIWDPGRCHFIPSGDGTGSASGCYTVTAGVSPGECGSVILSPASNCPGGYTAGSSVQLRAEAANGCTFQFWSGTCPGAFGTGDTVLITVSGHCSATAHFRP